MSVRRRNLSNELPGVRSAKVTVLRMRRLAAWAVDSRRVAAPVMRSADDYPHAIYGRQESIFRTDGDPRLERGKRHNVAMAASSLNGIALSPNVPLSFWRAVGRPTGGRGFRHGMELRGGCIVPTVGGGLCLLSELGRVATARRRRARGAGLAAR